MKTCIIVNPNAGSVADLAELKAVLGREPGTTVHFSEEKGDAERLAREALRGGAERVVAAGGDGTLNEVVNGLAEDFGRVRLGPYAVGCLLGLAAQPFRLRGGLAAQLHGHGLALGAGL